LGSLLKSVPVNKVKNFEEQLLTSLENSHPEVLETFRKGKLDPEAVKVLETLAADLVKQYS